MTVADSIQRHPDTAKNDGSTIRKAMCVPMVEPGRKCEVSEEVQFYFLELLPPRWMHGSMFTFGEGCGPFRLFWQTDGRFFGRELTDEETGLFCLLTGTAMHQ